MILREGGSVAAEASHLHPPSSAGSLRPLSLCLSSPLIFVSSPGKKKKKKSTADSGSSPQIMCTWIPNGHEPAAMLEQSEPKHNNPTRFFLFSFKIHIYSDRLRPHASFQVLKRRIRRIKEASRLVI